MEHMQISALFKTPPADGAAVSVCGWAKTVRDSKSIGFIELSDGSCFKNLQVVFQADKVANYKEVAKAGVGTSLRVTGRVEEAVRDADVVMGLRIQLERQQAGLFPSVREYHARFGLNDERLAMAKPHALVMHPGPMNRGVEISSFLADGPDSVIQEQVTNGVAVRMAVMFLLTRRGE